MDYELLVSCLKKLQLTVFTAESCTGGLIAKKITDVPGASKVLSGGIVSYTNEIKKKLLGVKEETLEKYSAVSAETAMEMARGALKYADIGISTTGYASAGEDYDAGLVFIGLAFGDKAIAFENHFNGSRDEIRNSAADTACSVILETLGIKESYVE